MFFHNRKDVVHDWYKRLDRFVGEIEQQVSQWNSKHRFLMLSDHGFSDFRKKVHLNRWLVENTYLCMKNGGDDLSGVDWNKTKAYAVGLNSIYLNVAGREGQGTVPADQIEGLLQDIQHKLSDWRDSNQSPIIQKVRLKHETFNGPFTRFGPDLVVGYAPGYRASAETGLGKIPSTTLEVNTDHWGADHCMDSQVVPGVIFANRDLGDFGTISFRDIPFLAIGKHLDQSNIKPPSQQAGEGQKDVEERLKGLGYL
jgi:predicted AlkP superfamily phosphohydrolase/phosphomutase